MRVGRAKERKMKMQISCSERCPDHDNACRVELQKRIGIKENILHLKPYSLPSRPLPSSPHSHVPSPKRRSQKHPRTLTSLALMT